MIAQLCWRPGLGGVAVLALIAKEPSVDLRFSVTGCALPWRTSKLAIDMAFSAFQPLVRSLQWENAGVVEAAHPVDPVVTVQAGCAILLLVALHKSCACVPCGVAAYAIRQHTGVGIGLIDCQPCHVFAMAGSAGQRFTCLVATVTGQAETAVCQVIEYLSLPLGWLPAQG